MKQILLQKGEVIVPEVPEPFVSSKNILVQVHYSCISVGTEMSGVTNSAMPLYKRALKQPAQFKTVVNRMKEQGVAPTLKWLGRKLDTGTPLGYSASGEVVAVGERVVGFKVGDRVGCAGAGIANHAEFIDVPVNLAVRVPDGLSMSLASTVTLGAISLQGVRRCNATLGETFVVIGLGILGQMTARLLQASGCRVIGLDMDPSRVTMATQGTRIIGITPSTENVIEKVLQLTDGIGADGVVITAAGSSNEIVLQAMNLCRKKGRVVLVGVVGLNLERSAFYAKELDFLISCSYGPGRYDSSYEEEGQDYPLPYVRWTENRNMETYLKLLADGSMDLSPLSCSTYKIEEAPAAYTALKAPGERPLLVLLDYNKEQPAARLNRIEVHPGRSQPGKISIGLAGAGSFARGMHLPNLERLESQYSIRGIMSRTGSTARAVAMLHRAAYATTDYQEILNDPEIQLVIICTRHNMHAPMVLEALKAGKHILVEKPLAIKRDEFEQIKQFYAGKQNPPVLLTGFNRRFSPAMVHIKTLLKGRSSPLIVDYRMNAGFIPRDNWVHGAEGGGRNIGEACHIYDLFNFLTDSTFTKVNAESIRAQSKQWLSQDNFVATVTYKDGSVCKLTYTSLGAKEYPKERMEVFCGGTVLSMDNFTEVTVAGSKRKGFHATTVNKGQFHELEVLADCLQKSKPWPISLEDQFAATEISFLVEEQL